MLRIVLAPFMYLAGVGLFATMVLHLSSIFKFPFEHYDKVFFLAGGVFVVWLPTVLVATKLTKDFKQKDFWKAAMRGCQPWLKKLTYVCFGYAAINFIYMIIVGPDKDSVSTARFVSGHLLPFYSAALATLYSAIHVAEIDNARRCKNGHPVSPSAKYCEECGGPVIEGKGKYSANP
jgi:hypothetical protein